MWCPICDLHLFPSSFFFFLFFLLRNGAHQVMPSLKILLWGGGDGRRKKKGKGNTNKCHIHCVRLRGNRKEKKKQLIVLIQTLLCFVTFS